MSDTSYPNHRGSDLFTGTEFAKPKRKPRVLLKVWDAGDNCSGEDGEGYFVHLGCEKCRYDADWQYYKTKNEVTSQPCPKCNAF